MGHLTGQVAIITGGSSGIGKATAELFAAEGARVVVASRTAHKAEAVAAGIRAQGGDAMAVPTDVADGEAVQRLVQATVDHYGRIDVLVNNAAVLPEPTPMAELASEQWDRVFDVNTKGVYRTIKGVWPHMAEQGGGVIVNTASVIAFRASVGMAAYCASKAAVVMLTRVLALEGASVGIRVNCVCPGFIDTPMNEWLGSVQPDQEAWLSDVLDRIPMHRPGRPEEIARANLYLASSDSSYMTGQVLTLDGGALA